MTEAEDYFDGSLGIAIIGMAGRFPGAKDIDEFWENLYAGAETVHFFTDEELKAAGVTQAELDNPNYVKAAPILEDIEFFDASFFDYTPMEASVMDPQQRLLLECAWQALEHAGYAGERDTDSIGVYAGSRINTYTENFFGHSDFMGAQGRSQIMLGNAEFALCTRISYKLTSRDRVIWSKLPARRRWRLFTWPVKLCCLTSAGWLWLEVWPSRCLTESAITTNMEGLYRLMDIAAALMPGLRARCLAVE